MKRQQNEPTVQYCIEAYLTGTKTVVDRFTIEQVEVQKGSGITNNANYNTVQRHLAELSVRTTLDYAIVRWGDVVDRSAWVAGQEFED